MDYARTGQLIRRLRVEKGMTQAALATLLQVSDKTVSKWECARGCPEVSLLGELARVLSVDVETLLSGETNETVRRAIHVAKTVFYVCPVCGNIITAAVKAAVTCCGKKLTPHIPHKAEESEHLSVDTVEGEYYITSEHPMTREHYISFVAVVTDDSLMLRKSYPEWDLGVRVPMTPRGRLFWYCTEHGLFYQAL